MLTIKLAGEWRGPDETDSTLEALAEQNQTWVLLSSVWALPLVRQSHALALTYFAREGKQPRITCQREPERQSAVPLG